MHMNICRRVFSAHTVVGKCHLPDIMPTPLQSMEAHAFKHCLEGTLDFEVRVEVGKVHLWKQPAAELSVQRSGMELIQICFL